MGLIIINSPHYMMHKIGYIAWLLLLCFIGVQIEAAKAQTPENFPFEIELRAVTIPALPGFHSFAFAQHEGRWLIVGGRTDGLHPRQPFTSFPVEHNNTRFFVIDPASGLWKSASITDLPVGPREQLQATNLNFAQWGDTLFVIGGYGFSASRNDHITHPSLSAILVPDVMDAIWNERPFDSYIHYREEDRLAITGGQLGRIDSRFYLAGGHRFDGRYNPMGFATYVQTYRTEVLVFSLGFGQEEAEFTELEAWSDPTHLRRRDYNLVPYIHTDGEPGYLISAGVFKEDADLPFLYPVEIRSDGHQPVEHFDQLLSHYHSPKTAFYDTSTEELHMLFFGGLAQFYFDEGTLVQDDLVPFVRTISRVSRGRDGAFREFALPVEMPGLRGTSAEFIPNIDLLRNETGVAMLPEVPDAGLLLGHIIGGIVSPSLNPFAFNQTSTTAADPSVFEVWLKQGTSTHLEVLPEIPSQVILHQNYPNPFNPKTSIRFSLTEPAHIVLEVSDLTGRIVDVPLNGQMQAGNHAVVFDGTGLASGVYLYRLMVGNSSYSRRMVLLK
jgi:hypothetical protein